MKRIWLTLSVLAFAAVFHGSALAQATTVDHFRCYLAPATGVMSTFVQLQDQFDAPTGIFEDITSLSIVRHCNPVEKIVNGVDTPIVNINHHLVMFQFNTQPIVSRTVVVNNQFGTQTLAVAAPTILAVPSGKILPPGTPPPPSPDLDHYKCYNASGPALANIAATLKDQFRTDTVQVIQPVLFCNPVEKIHGELISPIQHPAVHLVCYSTSIVQFQTDIIIQNQFFPNNHELGVRNPDMLCLPSSKLSWSVTGASGSAKAKTRR
jgi:hypothetical protein